MWLNKVSPTTPGFSENFLNVTYLELIFFQVLDTYSNYSVPIKWRQR